ncbi:MAG: hypothetical protein ABSE50_20930 [Xanthobacteraceae bacterium]|jgi:type IV secretory pathway VirD2 relaxase
MDAHLRYLEREGGPRTARRDESIQTDENEADGRTFIARGREDRHQFRFIVAPEDSVEIAICAALTAT